MLPAHHRPPGRAEHELPRRAALRGGWHHPSAGRSARAARTRPARHRRSWPPTSTATVGRTPSSTGPVRPGTSSGAARARRASPSRCRRSPAPTGRSSGDLDGNGLRRRRVARHRQRPGRRSGGRGQAAPTARCSTSTARTSPSSATSTATARTTCSGTAPGPAPRRCGTSAPTAPSRRCGWRQDLITGVPVVGDFDGDGRDDIFLYGPGPADDELWWSTGQAFRRTHLTVDRLVRPVALDATRRRAATTSSGRPRLARRRYRWEFDTGRAIVEPGLPRARG